MSIVQDVDYLAIAPPLVLAVASIAVLLADVFRPAHAGHGVGNGAGKAAGDGALLGLAIALAAVVTLAVDVATSGQARGTFCLPAGVRGAGPASCSYVVDEFTLLFQLVVLVAGVVVVLMARAEVQATKLPTGEFHFLLLAALTGALSLVAARDLVTLVVSLEVVSLPVFALVALRRYDGRSAEAGMKMFLISVISTAVMLFGISLVYGVTGTLQLDRIAGSLPLTGPTAPVASVGVVLVLVGFGFKIAAVPFHFWAPDTYQGAPIAVAAFLSVISKAAGFAGLILVLTTGFGALAREWGPLLAVLAAASMTLGNLVALRQREAVRLLAWSSIAQAGYMLAPLGALGGIAAQPGASAELRELVGATVGYVAIYAVMNIGAFAVVAFVGWVGSPGRGASLLDYRGLFRQHPFVAGGLAFFLTCLAGLPPGLAGLFAKIVVFRAVLTGGYGWLAVVLAINTVIGLYYYLSWAALLFGVRQETAATDRAPVPRPVGIAIAVAAVATVLLSLVPQLVLGISPLAASLGN